VAAVVGADEAGSEAQCLRHPEGPCPGVGIVAAVLEDQDVVGPFEVTLTGGSIGASDQNAHGQMLSGMPSLSGRLARAAAVRRPAEFLRDPKLTLPMINLGRSIVLRQAKNILPTIIRLQ
jgi:hypothetical protein